MSYALEKGHESGATPTVRTVVLARDGVRMIPDGTRPEGIFGLLLTTSLDYSPAHAGAKAPT